MRHGVRQSELAELIGYDQTYISAVEVGLKGPPTPEFIYKVAEALELSDADRLVLLQAADASQRKLVIDLDTPQDGY
jgi:transcriptional regulator with XRE-family HTH domain